MTFEYNKICRLCLNSSNTYLMNIFNGEYNIVEKISELIHLEVFQQDPFPKVICTDCYSNLLIFSEFKRICKNSDDLLRKYQINKGETEVENASAAATKGNGKCKSIRNSEEMANRIKECAFKKSMTFIENMKNFYFLLNQIEDLETNGGAQVIIKNEISSESLIPAVEINIKNEIIYPNDENLMGGSVIQQTSSAQQQQPQTSGTESKRKRRKSNKRKFINNGQTMEIDETGNIVARQILVANDQSLQQHHHHQNLQITTTQNENNEMALMLTVKPVDSQDSQQITVSHSQIQPIQIHSNNTLPSITTPTSSTQQTVTTILQYSCSSCHEIFNTTDSLRQHLLHSHQILFPFTTTSTADHQYQQVTIPQTSVAQISAASIPQVTQQFTTFTHKKYFESDFPCMLCSVVLKNQEELIKHMINHTSTNNTATASSSNISTAIPVKVTTIVERDRNSIDITPTDLSSSTTQYK